jgi:hypothetical protein
MMTTNTEALARDWLEAKRAEAVAQAQRIAIEEQIVAALGARDEGAQTHTVGDYKVTLTQPVTRKLDEKKWSLVASQCPAALQPVKVKVEADATGCKWLANNEPEIWRKIADAFTTTKGKVGVKVEKNDGN